MNAPTGIHVHHIYGLPGRTLTPEGCKVPIHHSSIRKALEHAKVTENVKAAAVNPPKI
jgi:hypothetical protein